MNQQEDEQHQATLRRSLEQNKELLEEHLAKLSDPAKAVQVVYNIQEITMELEQPKIYGAKLTPDQYLTVLDRTENWYTSRDLLYPQPARLKEQRTFWESRKQATSS